MNTYSHTLEHGSQPKFEKDKKSVMNLSIVIVSWNGKELLRECLNSIFGTISAAGDKPPPYGAEQATPRNPVTCCACGSNPVSSAALSFQIFVVDNGSKDGTPEMVRSEFPQVKLIVNEKNLGFAKANNQALNQLLVGTSRPLTLSLSPEGRGWGEGGDFILLLNQDMRVLPGTLAGMMNFMHQHPEAGVAGCHLIQPQDVGSGLVPPTFRRGGALDASERRGTSPCPTVQGSQGPTLQDFETVLHVRRFPTWRDQAAIILKLPYLFPVLLDGYLMKGFDYDKKEPQEVDSIRGSFFMIRRGVLEKIGILDERYFFFFDEVDYCRRVKEAGWKVMYNGAVKCVDLVGQSVKKIPLYQRQKMFLESMLEYFKKWQPRWQWMILDVLRPFGVALVWMADFILSLRGVRLGRTTKQSR